MSFQALPRNRDKSKTSRKETDLTFGSIVPLAIGFGLSLVPILRFISNLRVRRRPVAARLAMDLMAFFALNAVGVSFSYGVLWYQDGQPKGQMPMALNYLNFTRFGLICLTAAILVSALILKEASPHRACNALKVHYSPWGRFKRFVRDNF